MNRRTTLIGLLCALSLWASTPSPVAAAPGENPAPDTLYFTLSAKSNYSAPSGPLKSLEVRRPGPEGLELKVATSVPTFTRTIVARGRTYRFTLVGSDPFVRNARKVSVPLQIIPVRFRFDDGTILDPTLANPPCAGGSSPLGRVLDSPIVKSRSYGDGNRQFEEQIRRFEFWTKTGARGALNPSYSVRVSTTVLPTLDVTVEGFPTLPSPCGQIGLIDINTWDQFIKTTIFPELGAFGVNPRTFPLFLFSNVVLFDEEPDNCCILGYHSAFNFGGTQTYGIADYDVSRLLPGTSDVSVLSHELAEWYDDPFVNNPTPPWGHIGQVPGCQANLEVGDPLSGSLHSVTMPNGFTYHPQELAFFSWFYNQVPSLGVNGWYSSGGTFRRPAAVCQ